jgi:SAM-dependent methyltransferase
MASAFKKLVKSIPMMGPVAQGAWRAWLRTQEVGRLSGHDRKEIFLKYYQQNTWRDPQSRSGVGSNLQATVRWRDQLPGIWRQFGVGRVLDIPCGDFAWMSRVNLNGFEYVGADLIEEIVALNERRHSRPGISFRCLDLVNDALPSADLIFCRDCLVHFCSDDIKRSLANVRASGASWLMTTCHPYARRNVDILTGQWRPLNLEKEPFGFPPPRFVLREFRDDPPSYEAEWAANRKCLAIWAVADLPVRSGPIGR